MLTGIIWSIKVERPSTTFTELCGKDFLGEHNATKRARDCATQTGKVTVYKDGEVVGIITNNLGNVTKQEMGIVL